MLGHRPKVQLFAVVSCLREVRSPKDTLHLHFQIPTFFFVHPSFVFFSPCPTHPSPNNVCSQNPLFLGSQNLVEKRQLAGAGFWGRFWMGSPHREKKRNCLSKWCAKKGEDLCQNCFCPSLLSHTCTAFTPVQIAHVSFPALRVCLMILIFVLTCCPCHGFSDSKPLVSLSWLSLPPLPCGV